MAVWVHVIRFRIFVFKLKIERPFENVVSKRKANYKLMLLVHKEKNFQEIIKISITKLFT